MKNLPILSKFNTAKLASNAELLSESGVIHTLPLLLIIAAVGIISFLLISSTIPTGGLFGILNPKPSSHAASTGCVFSNGAQPIFCDTFDRPMGIGNRSGDLNGLIWGASRIGGDTQDPNFWTPWNYTPEDQCGNTVVVHPEGDIHICNGMLIEAMNDGQDAKELTMYPKQPFDFANRTGYVVFDVNNDTEGPHTAWPEFWITDTPIPGPHGKQNPGSEDFSKNAFGFSLALGGDVSDCVGVDTMFKITNWVYTQYDPQQPQDFQRVNCVKKSTSLSQLNHYEVRISQNHVEVWGTDAGSSTLKQMAVLDNLNLNFTRGLIWMNDVHYNGCKSGATQCVKTWAWDNVGFDGPYTYNDLAYDVADNTPLSQFTVDYADEQSGHNSGGQGLPMQIIGYHIPSNSSQTFTFNNVQRSAFATKGWIMLNYDPQSKVTINYSVNGHQHSLPWPFPDSSLFVRRSTALPIDDPTEIHDGTNTVILSTTDGFVLSNIDLILVGAGAHPCSINPSDPCFGTPVPTPTPCPTCTPQPSATPPAPTPSPTPAGVPSGLVRDNTGGSYTDTAGNGWSGDFGVNGGFLNSTTNPISNTTDAKLYQTERFGNFSYSYNVPNGNYNVTLKFAEFFWTGAGKRTFNVAINGNPVLTNFDIFADAGAGNKADDKTFPVTVTNGNITLTFASIIDNAKIDSFSIVPVSTGSSSPSASPNCSKLSIGDANCSGAVDLLDYSTVIAHFGQTVARGTNGDVNSSGAVDLLDYSTIIAHFGQ